MQNLASHKHLGLQPCVVLALILLGLVLAENLVLAESDFIEVQILAINDLHGHISQTEVLNGRPVGGAAYLAAYMLELEAEAESTIRVHAGDAVGASPPVSGLLQDEPTIEILSFLGFDVGVPGNHEFDEGLAELYRLQHGGRHPVTGYFRGSSFPLVLANAIRRDTGDPIFPPYVIKVVRGVPIAFIGVVTTETPSIVIPDRIDGLEFTDPAEAVNQYVEEITTKGVEAIVILAHEGGTYRQSSDLVQGPIVAIAEEIDDSVDIIVSGHTHQGYVTRIDGKLVVQAYSKGTALADIDLVIDRVTGDVKRSTGRILTMWADTKEPDQRVSAVIRAYEEKVKPLTGRAITASATALTREQTESGESALGSLIADAHRWATQSQIAFTNPGGIRSDLPSGTLTWGMLYEVQPFGNDVVRLTMTGEQVLKVLEQQWHSDQGSTRVRFLQVSGLRYAWDDTRPVSNKVVSAALDDGTPVARESVYTVAVNSFLASGGDGFTAFQDALSQTAVTNELEALAAYLESLEVPVKAPTTGRITKSLGAH